MKRSLNLLHDLFNSELTIRIIDTFIMNIYSSGKHCDYYSVSFEDLLEEINRNDNYRKISDSELDTALIHLMSFNVIIESYFTSESEYGMNYKWYHIFNVCDDKIDGYLR